MRLTTIVIVLLALLVAACGSDQPSEAPSEPDPTPAATPEPTEAPSEEPDASAPAASELAFPSFDINGDPELAARLPATVDGQPLQIISMRGDMFMGGEVDPAFQDFLDATGADLEDVSVAFGGVQSGESFISIAAFRVLGVTEEELEQEFIGASQDAGDLASLEEATIGGKQVWTAIDPTGELGGAGIYIYARDDTLYWMTGTEEQAAEILEALP